MLKALLTGKEVVYHVKEKTQGVPNNTGVNRKIDEVLKVDANRITLGIAKADGVIWTGNNTESFDSYGTPGNVFFVTNKTANGTEATVKVNVSKLSKQHSDILFEAILQRFHLNQGRSSLYKGEGVEGKLTVGQVIDMLVLFGKGTSVQDPNNVNKPYLESKQLFVDNGPNGEMNLHFGTNVFNLKEIYNGHSDKNTIKKAFIDWATNNKNYVVLKQSSKDLGFKIELNKLLRKNFKIGD